MQRTRVGVLRGGISSEYDISLKTGDAVLYGLSADKHNVLDILITKDGQWHMKGFPVEPDKIARNVDIVFNALHGEYGEDGKIQQTLESFNIPYTGSGIVPSAVGMNKNLAKKYFEFYGIQTPKSKTIKQGENVPEIAQSIFKKMYSPYIIKPISDGSSLGVRVIRSFEDLVSGINEILEKSKAVLVEEYIKGREVTCAVVDGLDSNDSFALPLLEIITPDDEEILSYDARHGGKATKVSPANIEKERTEIIQKIATEAHKKIGLRHFSTADFIVSPRGIYLLELNSQPGLSEGSSMPTILKAGGFELPEFLDYLIELALVRK